MAFIVIVVAVVKFFILLDPNKNFLINRPEVMGQGTIRVVLCYECYYLLKFILNSDS